MAKDVQSRQTRILAATLSLLRDKVLQTSASVYPSLPSPLDPSLDLLLPLSYFLVLFCNRHSTTTTTNNNTNILLLLDSVVVNVFKRNVRYTLKVSLTDFRLSPLDSLNILPGLFSTSTVRLPSPFIESSFSILYIYIQDFFFNFQSYTYRILLVFLFKIS